MFFQGLSIIINLMKRFTVLVLLLFPLLSSAAVLKLRIEGPIDTIAEEYAETGFRKAESIENLKLIILELDTPGGFDTSMRSIIKNILNAEAPVAVFVSPRGARAMSAGFFIAIASDIACMSPGTSTGAAHPVSVTGAKIEETMKEKITNDAVSYIKSLARTRNRNLEFSEKAVRDSEAFTAEESLRNNLIEFIAEDLADLLKQLDGKTIKRPDGGSVTLDLGSETVTELEMSWRQRFLRTITNPNLAYFLLIFGLIGLYLEFTHPGTIIPGVLGGISLLLAFLAFQILPINYVGLFLILLSIGFFIAEIKVQGFGMLGIGGVIAFLLGSIMLIDSPIPEMRPAMSIIIALTVSFGLVALFLTYKVIQAMRRKSETGQEGLCGEIGTARTDIDGRSGKVFIHGEWWKAVSDSKIPAGTRVEVLEIKSFTLKVRALEADADH